MTPEQRAEVMARFKADLAEMAPFPVQQRSLAQVHSGRCSLPGCDRPATSATAKYCSEDHANEGRRRWHAAHPGGNGAMRQEPVASHAGPPRRLTRRAAEEAAALPKPAPVKPAQPVVACALDGCDKPVAPGHRYCSTTCSGEAQTRRTLAYRAEIAAGQRQAPPSRQPAAEAPRVVMQQPLRPTFTPTLLASIVIGPPRPAPVKRYRDTGRPCEFQDDLAAMADKGSPGPLFRPLAHSASSALANCA